MSRRLSIRFVCQAGELEAQALLLAASLRRWLTGGHELIAAVPEPASRWGKPSAAALKLLEALGVRIVTIENPINPDYPIGNKLACMDISSDADKLILLDSDMLCLRPFGDEPRFAVPFNARTASNPVFWDADEKWGRLYAACEAIPPRGKVRTTVSARYILPYFNSGFVAVNNGLNFAEVWRDCCRRIDALPDLPQKRPYLDQLGLAVAVGKLGLDYDVLEDRYNHAINFKPIDAADVPLIAHYHDPATLAREPALVAAVGELCAMWPGLLDVLKKDAAWSAQLLGAQPPSAVRNADEASTLPSSRAVRNPPEIVITGIPRSGTSYLCNLLHRYDNCVMLNEPPEIADALAQPIEPWGVPVFYRQARADVLAGRPIRNKLKDGQVTEDTTEANELVAYTPAVRAADFVLGAKTTIAFLSRIESVRRVMPWARIVACVRDPFAAIASWKTTFDHLRDADVGRLKVGGPADPWLSTRQRMELEKVVALSDPAERRAAFWRYLAELILHHQRDLILVPYVELVLRPAQTIAPILAGFDPGELREPIRPSTIRAKTDALDAADIQAIRALCADVARRLGVWDDDGAGF